MTEETLNSQRGRELQEAAGEVMGQFKDQVSRSCAVKRASDSLRWQVNFLYTLPWGGLQPVPSLIIEEAYPFIPARELLKSKMRAHLLANPPKIGK